MPLILGSQSPRRREIMGYFSLPFLCATPPFDEESVIFSGDPQKFAIDISRGKAASLLPLYPDSPILTADTVVYKDGKVYGKPIDEKEALGMLQELSGHWHSVLTGMTLKTSAEEHTICQETRVLFQAANRHQLEQYLRQVAFRDKAGSYAIQTAGGIIAQRIDGCFYNVMGLPLAGLSQLLSKIGIDLWDYLK
jgi:septum formation protein